MLKKNLKKLKKTLYFLKKVSYNINVEPIYGTSPTKGATNDTFNTYPQP